MRRVLALTFSICIVNCIGLLESANAATHYVWCGATGAKNGTEWTDAYADLPASLTRGDTYYIAGSNSCTYAAHTFSDAPSGGSVISVVRATAANSGAVAGWEASFGTAPAKWVTTMMIGSTQTFWYINQGYYTFDGQFGSGNASGTFGFWLRKAADNYNPIWVDDSPQGQTPYLISNLVFNHIEIDGVSINWATLVNGAEAFFTQGRGTVTNPSNYSNISFQNDYFHDIETGYLQVHTIHNLTVDHSWFARSIYNTGAHGNGVAINPGIFSDGPETSSNLTFSHDTWEDVCGTSVITFMNGDINVANIYGNVFFQTKPLPAFTNAPPLFCDGQGTVGDLGPGGAITTNVNFYNNTIFNASAVARTGVDFYNTSASNIVQQDNLVFNSQYVYFTTGGIGDVEDHNTVINSILNGSFTCSGTANSCQSANGINISSASVASNVADVVTSTAHSLNVGDPVVVLGTQVESTRGCGADTWYPYPTVSHVVSTTEFKYTLQATVPNATCQNGFGSVFVSPVTIPFVSPSSKNFQLSSEAVDPHLNDGTALTAPYNVDPNGNRRGADGTWERGAYEYVRPKPSVDLRVIVH